MPSTRVRTVEDKLPQFTLIFFAIDGTTVIKSTDQLKWVIRGETCRIRINTKEVLDGKVLAMRGRHKTIPVLVERC